jgi:hypothetical protein
MRKDTVSQGTFPVVRVEDLENVEKGEGNQPGLAATLSHF